MRAGTTARLAAVLCMMLFVSAACGPSGDGEGGGDQARSASAATLIDLQNFATGEPDHIDPALATTVQAAQPGHLLFDGLTEIDDVTGQARAAVAQSWSSSADATTWVFTLRPDVSFSNGDPVLPSDFKFAWERVVKPALASPVSYHFTDNLRIRGAREVAAGRAEQVEGIVADDAARTLSLSLESPITFVPEAVAHLAFSPVPRAVVTALPDQAAWEQGVMVGNGPYVMAEAWKHDQYIRLQRNEGYWGGASGVTPRLEAIEFRISKDVGSAFLSFEAGDGHLAYVPAGQLAEAKRKYPDRLSTRPLTGVYYWGFNMTDPVVGGDENLKLRQAIALGIDKQRIVDTVYSGVRQVATGWTPPATPGYQPGMAEFAAYDVARAQQLVREWQADTGKAAGDLPPLEINFSAASGHDPVASVIEAGVEALGIRADLDPIDARTYFSQMRAGEGQFFWAGWVADYNAYDNLLFPNFFSSQAQVGDNLVQYRSRPFDDLITAARREPDAEARAGLYRRAEAMVLNQDTAAVPLNWYAGQVVWADPVFDVRQSPLAFLGYDKMWLSS